MLTRMATTRPKHRTRDLFERQLLEQVADSFAPTESPLSVDEANGVIRRVKLLGRFSRNSHGMTEAENGTDYAPCMAANRAMYEGLKVKCDHPSDRANPGRERSVRDTLGVIRNVVLENDESGNPALWGDMHCNTDHDMYKLVLQDVKKGLGLYGLSHNAAAKRERFDQQSRRLVIEELAVVRSVDLVDRPATNRNLWESETVKTTLRSLIESRAAGGKRAKWKRWLLEEDGMMSDETMDAPMDTPMAGEEGEAAWSGFMQEIQVIGEKVKAKEMDAKTAGKKVMAIFKAHESLFGSSEPTEEPDDYMDVSEEETMTETPESVELAQLRAEKAARSLFESVGHNPTQLQIEAVAGMKDAKKQRELAESFKGNGYKVPRSSPPAAPKQHTAGRNVTESAEDHKASVAGDLALLRG